MKKVEVFEGSDGKLYRHEETARRADLALRIKSVLGLDEVNKEHNELVKRLIQYRGMIIEYLQEVDDGVIRG